MPKFRLKLPTLMLVLFVVSPISPVVAQQQRPNVLLIMIEDLNQWVGYLGGPRLTPNIDGLASKSHHFMNAYCVSPVCNASRVALMTGQRPSVNGMVGNIGNFRDLPQGDSRLTMAEYFRQQGGYGTLSAGKIFHAPLGSKSDPRSWDYQHPGNVGANGHGFYIDENEVALWLNGCTLGNPFLEKYAIWGRAIEDDGTLERTEDTHEWKHAEFVAEFLEQEHDQPFFLGFGPTATHLPFIAPKEFYDQVNARYPGGVPELYLPEQDLEDITPHAHRNFSTPLVETAKAKGQLDDAVEAYLAAISFQDAAIGHVLEALENSVYANNTIVVLASDHGFQLGHKDRFGKLELWKRSSHVPLMIKLPGQVRGKRINHSVSLLDIFPTLTELAGLPENKNTHGRSLVELMATPQNQPISSAVVNAVGYTGLRHEYAVNQDGWHYILRTNGDEELYNHATDPLEIYNLSHLEANEHRKSRMASEIVRTALQVANRDFDYSQLETLGSKTSQSFEHHSGGLDTDAEWTTLRFGRVQGNDDFSVSTGGARSVPGRLLARHNLSLKAEHDFVVAADVELHTRGIGAGVAFGILDADNYFEFLITDVEFNDGADVILRKWTQGIAYDILVESDLADVTAGSSWNLIANYDVHLGQVTLTVLDESKNTYFKSRVPLFVEPGTGMGLSSYYHSNAEFDNFRAIVVPKLPYPEPRLRVELNCAAINNMEHIDTFEHLEPSESSLEELGWEVYGDGDDLETAMIIEEGKLKSAIPTGKVVSVKNEPVLEGADDFVLVANLRFTGAGDSAGVVFFFEDVDNYCELSLVDENVRGEVDIELNQYRNGTKRNLVSDSNLTGLQLGHEYVIYLRFSRGVLKIEVFDKTESSRFYSGQRLIRRIEGTSFGTVVRDHGACEFDYVRVVSGLRATALEAECYKLD